MNQLPDPMTPADCDLRGMPFMPVDIVRLFDSDLHALSTGDEFKAAFTLWGKAFLQVPAGSLPDDDRILAHLSMTGSAWKKVRTMALRNWVKCSDGRLYHPVVAEKAREAWSARLAQRQRTEAARAARAAKREAPRARDDRQQRDRTTEAVTSSVTETVTGSKGQGQGQGIEEASSLRSDGAPAAPPPAAGQSPDQRTELWRVGLPGLVRMTGKPEARCRAILGRLLADAGDNCELVSRKLFEAEERRVVDPVAWLEAAVRTATGARIPAHRPGQGSGFGQFVRGMRSAQAAHAGPMFDGVADEVPAA